MLRSPRVVHFAIPLALLWLAACGDDTAAVGPADKDVAQQAPDVDAQLSGDATDGTLLPDTDDQDLASAEVLDVTGDIALVCPGQPGCECQDNKGCTGGLCIDTAAGKKCAKTCTENCDPGFNCSAIPVGNDTAFVCVPVFDWLCDPCKSSKDCQFPGLQDAACVSRGSDGSFCGAACAKDADCPADYACETATTVEGGSAKQCVRKASVGAGQCPCSDAAKSKKLATACFVETKDGSGNVTGKCPGTRSCGESGLSTCNGPPPGAEVCDGADNDCNGKTDENACEDNNACTTDVCAPGSNQDGCNHTKVDVGCDADGSVCTENDTCKDGVCKPGPAKVCDDGKPCTADACDPAKGCTQTADDGTACDADGDACTVGDTCIAGLCVVGKTSLCDDDNACTTDSCDTKTGKCAFGPIADGVACDDGTACTGSDQCASGACVGKALACDDKNPCTADGCDPQKGCTKSNSDGAPCDDDNPCTIGDICATADCQPGKAKTCAGGDACVTSKCDVITGKCTIKNKAAGEICDDGSKCTTGDACQSGECLGKVVSCDDDNPCSDDSCQPALGCKHSDNLSPCDDGNACTLSDTCATGECVAGKSKLCEDANSCTADTCDVATGKCKFAAIEAGCDDGSACTTGDTCKDGACTGVAAQCDDLNPCTADNCDKAKGCVHTPNSAPCDDSNACTDGDTCLGGKCAGTLKDVQNGCDDANPCTSDGCDAKSGCVHLPNQATCEDGNPCTVGDSCAGGKCLVGTNTCQCGTDSDCASKEDGNLCNGLLFCDKSKAPFQCTINPATVVSCPVGQNTACTANTCDAKTGKCAQVAVNEGKSCDADGSVCTQGDTCAVGLCSAGTNAVCDDANPCTDDTCDGKKGCVQLANAATCDFDSDACTPDVCAGKLCVTGKAKVCDDGNPCTADACSAKTGLCGFDAAPQAGKACDADGSVCTQNDACSNGKCTAGAALGCDDANPCTDDACDGKLGCTHAANGATCNADDNACSEGDICSGKVCLKGKLKVCDDNNACTEDSCDVKTGACGFDGVAPTGQACDADGTLCTDKDQCQAGKCLAGKALGCDDGNVCTDDACDAKSGCTHAGNTAACNADSSLCTENDVCKGGSCTAGAKKVCEDGNACTNDTCVATTGCAFAANTAPCEDGSVCTLGDACAASACAPGKAKSCDDGNPCTNDSCDAKTGCANAANTATCDDGNPCTESDACSGGGCKSGLNTCACAKDADCVDDGNLCNGTLFCDTAKLPYQCKVDAKTVVVCDVAADTECQKNQCAAVTGKCAVAQVNEGKSCSDGNACSTGDACAAGTCKAGLAANCDDGNACTSDGCDGKTGCTHQADTKVTAPCYSGPAGTETVGVCKGGTKTCLADGSFGACKGEVVPAKEACNLVDDDCNAKVDEGCTPAGIAWKTGAMHLAGTAGKVTMKAWIGGNSVVGSAAAANGKTPAWFGFYKWARSVLGK